MREMATTRPSTALRSRPLTRPPTSVGRVAGEDDAQLVKAAVEGDKDAWAALVARFSGLIWSITLGFRLRPSDAADVNQTCWLRLLEHLHRIEEPQKVGAWIATVARRECLAVLHRTGREVPTEGDEDDGGAAPMELDGAMLRTERQQAVWNAYLGVSPRCRALLQLLSTDPPASYREISAALDMPHGSIGPNWGRCLKCLRHQLQLLGFGPDDAGS